jgi:hypothetical protein
LGSIGGALLIALFLILWRTYDRRSQAELTTPIINRDGSTLQGHVFNYVLALDRKYVLSRMFEEAFTRKTK